MNLEQLIGLVTNKEQDKPTFEVSAKEASEGSWEDLKTLRFVGNNVQ